MPHRVHDRILHAAESAGPGWPVLLSKLPWLVFGAWAGLDFLVGQIWPGRGLLMLDLIGNWGWREWTLAGVIVLFAVFFEGSFRLVRRIRTDHRLALEDLQRQLAQAQRSEAEARERASRAEALPQQMLTSAEMTARVELAGLITRFHRMTVGHDKDEADAKPLMARAGALKDQLSHHPEALALWQAFWRAQSDMTVRDDLRKLNGWSPSAEEVERLFLEGDPLAKALETAADDYRNWLLMRG